MSTLLRTLIRLPVAIVSATLISARPRHPVRPRGYGRSRQPGQRRPRSSTRITHRRTLLLDAYRGRAPGATALLGDE